MPSLDDAADDPAIWVAPDDAARSLIVGTDKGSGLLVYNLAGEQLQYLPNGEFNNVDLRQNPWGRDSFTLLAATQRNPARLALFTLDHVTRSVEQVASWETELAEPYGICLYQPDGELYVIANSKDGRFVQYRVGADYSLNPVRRWRTGSQPEGCVASDEDHVLYVGEEAVGVWTMDARPDGAITLEALDRVGSGRLIADVEGMALVDTANGRLLVVSSQGDNSFAVYDTNSREHLFSFHIVGDDSIDGASETDGLDVTGMALPGFPGGLLVVQDGYNLRPTAAQNFKLVSWAKVLAAAER